MQSSVSTIQRGIHHYSMLGQHTTMTHDLSLPEIKIGLRHPQTIQCKVTVFQKCLVPVVITLIFVLNRAKKPDIFSSVIPLCFVVLVQNKINQTPRGKQSPSAMQNRIPLRVLRARNFVSELILTCLCCGLELVWKLVRNLGVTKFAGIMITSVRLFVSSLCCAEMPWDYPNRC